MKKHLTLLSLFFVTSQIFAVVLKLENKAGKNIEYKINKAKSKGWKELKNGGKASAKIGLGKIVVEWRSEDDHYVSHNLNKPKHFLFKVNGRYEVTQKDWRGRSKTIDDNFLYSFARLPEYLSPKIRKKFLLPLARLKKGIDGVKSALQFYKEDIERAKRMITMYDDVRKNPPNEQAKKDATKEIANEEKRIKAYGAEIKKLKNLEKELLIREIIEITKQRMEQKGETESYRRNIDEHKKMFQEVTGYDLPTEYMLPSVAP